MSDTLSRTLPRIARVADLADHQARMDQPLVSYRQIAPAGRSPAPPPAFLFGPSDPELTRQIYGQIETPEIGVTSIEDAAIAPTGVGIRGDVAFASAALNHPREHVATIAARLNEMGGGDTVPPCRQVPGPLVPLFGPAEDDTMHLLVDYLPRLWLLDQAGYALDALTFLVPDGLSPFLQDLVAALGIPPARLVRYAHWAEVIRTDLLVLPTILRRHDRLSPYFGQATAFWITRLRATLAQPPPVPIEKLYIATPDRPGLPHLRNRHRIEAVAERRGYRVANPEQMSFAERAALFSRASHIVGPYTSMLHHSLLASEGTRICALRAAQRDSGTLQTGVAAAMGQTVGYVFGGLDHANCSFNIEESDFRRALDLLDIDL